MSAWRMEVTEVSILADNRVMVSGKLIEGEQPQKGDQYQAGSFNGVVSDATSLGDVVDFTGAPTIVYGSGSSLATTVSFVSEKTDLLRVKPGTIVSGRSGSSPPARRSRPGKKAVEELAAKLESTDSYPTAVATIEAIARHGHEALGAIPAIVDKAASGGQFHLIFNSISIVDIAKACGQDGATMATTSLASSLVRVDRLMYWMTALIYIEELLDYGADGSASVPFLKTALETVERRRTTDADIMQAVASLQTKIRTLMARIGSAGPVGIARPPAQNASSGEASPCRHAPQLDVAEIDKGLVMVYFSAEWCAPCKVQARTLDAVAPQLAARAKVIRADVDEEKQLAERFGVKSVPTILLLREGKVVSTLIGVCNESKLLAAIEDPENAQKKLAGKGCLPLLACLFLVVSAPFLLAALLRSL